MGTRDSGGRRRRRRNGRREGVRDNRGRRLRRRRRRGRLPPPAVRYAAAAERRCRVPPCPKQLVYAATTTTTTSVCCSARFSKPTRRRFEFEFEFAFAVCSTSHFGAAVAVSTKRPPDLRGFRGVQIQSRGEVRGDKTHLRGNTSHGDETKGTALRVSQIPPPCFTEAGDCLSILRDIRD